MGWLLVRLQGRGGRGVTGARMRDDDTVEEVVNVMDHDTVLFFSPDGICRSLRAYQIPVSSKTAMGTPVTQVPAPSMTLIPRPACSEACACVLQDCHGHARHPGASAQPDPHHTACMCLKHACRRCIHVLPFTAGTGNTFSIMRVK